MFRLSRRVCVIFTALLLVALSLPGISAKAYTVGYGVAYNSSYVNLRQRPTQNSTRLGSYNAGTWVEITGESGNWYYVTGPDGKTGYMSKNFIEVATEVVRPVGIVSNGNASAFLNLRQFPSYNAKVLGIYYNGVPCTLLGLSDGWYQVNVSGTVGYFRYEYIRESNMVASDQVATIQTPNNSGLNLRSGPGMSYPVLKQYRGANYVMVLQKGTDWWKVSIDGYVGFMSSTFLKEGVLAPTGGGSSGGGGTSSGNGYAIISNPRSNQVLNLRESASTTSKVLGQYGNGTRVTILGQGTEWCKVKINNTGAIGYMMTDYLTLHNMPSTPTLTVNHPQGTFVNMRSTPSMTGNTILTHMPQGASVTVLIPGDSWAKVRYNGYTGYAVMYFLK